MDEETKYYSFQKKIWGLLAPFYDIITLPFSVLRDRVVDLAGAPDGSKLLEVATGTGQQAFAFAKRGYDVIAVDLSQAMLKVARRKNPYQNARFLVADATHLPFGDASFDVSCVSFALHEMPARIRERTLKEMVRVTRPGGLTMIVDYALPKCQVGRFLWYHFVVLYEGKLYANFIKSDFEALLGSMGIKIKNELRMLLGGARIIRGEKAR